MKAISAFSVTCWEKASVNGALVPRGKGGVNYRTRCREFSGGRLLSLYLRQLAGDGRGQRAEQRVEERYCGVAGTPSFTPASPDLLILDHVFFTSRVNPNLLVQETHSSPRVG